jgi:hypothetical protein
VKERNAEMIEDIRPMKAVKWYLHEGPELAPRTLAESFMDPESHTSHRSFLFFMTQVEPKYTDVTKRTLILIPGLYSRT